MADADARRRFGEAWQDRVRRMLVEHADDPAMVRVRRIVSRATRGQGVPIGNPDDQADKREGKNHRQESFAQRQVLMPIACAADLAEALSW